MVTTRFHVYSKRWKSAVSMTALLALVVSLFSMGALPSVRADDGAAAGELPGSPVYEDTFDRNLTDNGWIFSDGKPVGELMEGTDGRTTLAIGKGGNRLTNRMDRPMSEAALDQQVSVDFVWNENSELALWTRLQSNAPGSASDPSGYLALLVKTGNGVELFFRVGNNSVTGGGGGAALTMTQGDPYRMTFRAIGCNSTYLEVEIVNLKTFASVVKRASSDTNAKYQSPGSVGISCSKSEKMTITHFSYEDITFAQYEDTFDGAALDSSWVFSNGKVGELATGADGKTALSVGNGDRLTKRMDRPMSEAALDQQVSVDFVWNGSSELALWTRLQSNAPGSADDPSGYTALLSAGKQLFIRIGHTTLPGGGGAALDLQADTPYRMTFKAVGSNPTRLEAEITNLNTSASVVKRTLEDTAEKYQSPGSAGISNGQSTRMTVTRFSYKNIAFTGYEDAFDGAAPDGSWVLPSGNAPAQKEGQLLLATGDRLNRIERPMDEAALDQQVSVDFVWGGDNTGELALWTRLQGNGRSSEGYVALLANLNHGQLFIRRKDMSNVTKETGPLNLVKDSRYRLTFKAVGSNPTRLEAELVNLDAGVSVAKREGEDTTSAACQQAGVVGVANSKAVPLAIDSFSYMPVTDTAAFDRFTDDFQSYSRPDPSWICTNENVSAALKDGQLLLATGERQNRIERPMNEARLNSQASVDFVWNGQSELALWTRLQGDMPGNTRGEGYMALLSKEGKLSIHGDDKTLAEETEALALQKNTTYRLTFRAIGSNPTRLETALINPTTNETLATRTAQDSTAVYQKAGTVGISNGQDTPLTLKEFSYVSVTIPLLSNSGNKLEEGKLTVGYMGDSVMNGTGANTPATDSWPAKTTAYLKKAYPDAEIHVNTSVIGGTAALLGAARTATELLDPVPDLVFVGFNVNDAGYGHTDAESRRYMESIFRQIYAVNPYADIVVTLYGSSSDKGEVRNGNKISVYSKLAEYYGLPLINLTAELYKEIGDDSSIWGSKENLYFKDGLHMTTVGYEKYAQYVQSFLEKNLVAWGSYTEKSLPELECPNIIRKMAIIRPTEIHAANPGVGTVKEDLPGNLRYGNEYTLPAGKTISVKFSGETVGLVFWWQADDKTDTHKYRLDGGAEQTLQGTNNRPEKLLYDGLANGEHTLTITAGDKPLRIYCVLATGTPGEVEEFTSYTDDFNGTALDSSWVIPNTNPRIELQDGSLVLGRKEGTTGNIRNYRLVRPMSEAKLHQCVSVDFVMPAVDGAWLLLWTRLQDNGKGYYALLKADSIPQLFIRRNNSDGTTPNLGVSNFGNLLERGHRYRMVFETVNSGPVRLKAEIIDLETMETIRTVTTQDAEANPPQAGTVGISCEVPANAATGASVTLEHFSYEAVEEETPDPPIEGEAMIHNMKSAEYGRLRQIVTLERGKTYVYSLYENLDGKERRGQQMLIALRQNSGDTKGSVGGLYDDYSEPVEENGYYRRTYEFVTPAEGGYSATEGKVDFCIGLLLGTKDTEPGAYYYGLTLYAKDDPDKTNLLVNADFSEGFKGWYDSGGVLNTDWETRRTLSGDMELTECPGMDYFKRQAQQELEGEWMIHNKGTADWRLFGQRIHLEIGKTYVFSAHCRYLKTNAQELSVRYVPKGETNYKVISFTETETDDETCWFRHEFTLPADATVMASGKAAAFVGIKEGSLGADGYFYGFQLYEKDDPNKTNLFVNPNFKQGLRGWLGADMGRDHITEYGVMTTLLEEIELIPYRAELFINDTSDKYFTDGTGWADRFISGGGESRPGGNVSEPSTKDPGADGPVTGVAMPTAILALPAASAAALALLRRRRRTGRHTEE